MEKLEQAPNITRVVHTISLEIVEIDNDPQNLQVILRNNDSLPSDVVLLMLAEGAKVIKAFEKHSKRKEGAQ